jgi:predicted nucleotidyltransferase
MKNNINEKIKDKLYNKEFTEFCVKDDIKIALLFGSQVSGKAGYDSDFAAFSSLALRQHEDSRLFYELEEIYLRS